MLNTQPAAAECTRALERYVARLEGRIGAGDGTLLDRHLSVCDHCQRSCSEFHHLHGEMNRLLGARKLSDDFDAQSTLRLKQKREMSRSGSTSAAALSAVALNLPETESASPAESWQTLQDRLGAAPWWVVSVALHVLVIVLLGLITMSIGVLEHSNSVIVLTNLGPRSSSASARAGPWTVACRTWTGRGIPLTSGARSAGVSIRPCSARSAWRCTTATCRCIGKAGPQHLRAWNSWPGG